MSMTVTLSPEAAKIVQERVDSGEFPDAQAVVEAALVDEDFDADIEQWLRDVVVPTYDALEAGTMATYTPDEVRAHFAQLEKGQKPKTAAA